MKRNPSLFNKGKNTWGIAALSADLVPKIASDDADIHKLYAEPTPEPSKSIWDNFSRN